MSAAEITAVSAVTPERLAAWSERLDTYEEVAAATVWPDEARRVFRELAMAWLDGLAEYSRPVTIFAAGKFVKMRLAWYDALAEDAVRRGGEAR